MLRFTRVKVEAESTLNANISPGETELVHVVKLTSELICWVDRVGFSVPVIESESVGIVPAAFQTSITQSPV